MKCSKTDLLHSSWDHHFSVRTEEGGWFLQLGASKGLDSQWQSITLEMLVFYRWEWRQPDGLNSHRCCHWDHRAHRWVWPQSTEGKGLFARALGKAVEGQRTACCLVQFGFLCGTRSSPASGPVWTSRCISLPASSHPTLAPCKDQISAPWGPRWCLLLTTHPSS